MSDSEAVPMLSDVSHDELFASTQDEPTPEVTPEPQPDLPAPSDVQGEQTEFKVDATGRAHGADGKFVPKQAPADAAPIQQPPVENIQPGNNHSQPAQDQEAMVPSWRLREVRENAERRIQQEVERQVQAVLARQQPQQQEPQIELDPLTDPKGYQQAITNHFEQQRARDRLDFNLQLSRIRHGEKFDEAFQAFMQVAESDPQFGQAVVRSSNPGDTLWKWYQGQQTLREVGTDPTAYKQKLRDELLKDPAFQAEVIKAVNAAGASQQAGARPNNVTQLPPSLSKATGATANTAETAPTGAELFQHALRG